MAQTQSNQNEPSVGTAAAQAAAGHVADAKLADAKPAKPIDTKSTDAKPADAKPADAEGDAAGADAEAAEKREKKKFFVVVGQVFEFDSAKLAEDFLNGPDAPSDHTVLRGSRTKTNTRISLR